MSAIEISALRSSVRESGGVRLEPGRAKEAVLEAEEIGAKSSIGRRVTPVGALVPGKQDCYLHALQSIRQSHAIAVTNYCSRTVARSSSPSRWVQIISTRRRRCSVRPRSQLSASSVISKCFE